MFQLELDVGGNMSVHEVNLVSITLVFLSLVYPYISYIGLLFLD